MENRKFFTGSSNDAVEERAKHDYYATPPEATQLFLNNFIEIEELDYIWEPACGEGHISKVLKDNIIEVKSSDLIDRGYGDILDFLQYDGTFKGSILTNPPFYISVDFTKKALEIIQTGKFVIFFASIQFLESNKRRVLFNENIHSIYLHTKRVGCIKNGDPKAEIKKGIMFAWFVFKKGYKDTPKFYWL